MSALAILCMHLRQGTLAVRATEPLPRALACMQLVMHPVAPSPSLGPEMVIRAAQRARKKKHRECSTSHTIHFGMTLTFPNPPPHV